MSRKAKTVGILRERERERELTFNEINNNKINIDNNLKDSDKSLKV